MKHKYIYIAILAILSTLLSSYSSAFGIVKRILFEDFSPGSFSNKWEIREFKGKSDCRVVKEGNNFVFRLRSHGTSFLAYKKKNIRLADFRRLKWSWKVTKLPEDGDVRVKKKDDQAGQVYVRFPIIENPIENKLFGAVWNKVMSNDLNMYIVGYVWDSKAPVGLSGVNKNWSALRYVVMQSGFKNINKWINESRDIYEDYKMLFHRVPPKIIEGIGVMINSNNTNGSAETFYDNFILEKG